MRLSVAVFLCAVAAPEAMATVVAGNVWTTPGTPPPITPGTAQFVNCPDELPTWPNQFVTGFDKSQTSFYIYLPNNFDPNKTYGVISMIWGSDGGTALTEWFSTFDARNIIFIAPQGAGNAVDVRIRASLLLTGANLIKKYYKIDPSRVYLAGHSGGARTAGYTADNFPDLARGTIQSCGADYHEPIVTPDGFTGFGFYWTPPNSDAKTNVRFAFIEGANDGNYVGINDNYLYGYIAHGYQAMIENVPGMGHAPFKTPQLQHALNWIEQLTNTNFPAVALNQTVNVPANTAKAITLVATDETGDALTYATSTPLHGTLTGTGPVFTYTPATGYTGADSFTFTANDGNSDSNVATVTINVRANTAPVAATVSVSTAQNNSKLLTLTATDANSDALTYSIVTGPAHGTLVGTPPNLSYAPATNYNGSDSFTFKANDSYQDSNVATVNITVTFVNQSPVANNLSVLTTPGTTIPLQLTASDVDSAYLTYTVVTPPAHGTLSGSAPNVTYTPNAGYTGTDSFTFKAYDGSTYSAPATVSISPPSDLLPNLVVNGTFESPVVPSSAYTYGPGSTGVTGWQIDASPGDGVQVGAINVFGTNNGSQNLQLTGGNNVYSAGGQISQTVSTQAGATYLVSVDVASRQGAAVTGNLTFGGTSQTLTASSKTFVTKTWQMTASGSSTLLTLTGASNSASQQLVVDNVSVRPIVSPATVTAALIDHTFNEGTGTLNGTLVDAGTLKTTNPALAWVTSAANTLITANGAITCNLPTDHQCAYVPLGTAIASGAIYELTVTLAKPTSGAWVSAGFFDSATPSLANHMDDGNCMGTGWFLWGTNGSVEPSRGTKYDTAGNGYATTGNGTARTNLNISNSTQTFTIKLDMSSANGASNWGTMTVYAGDSATGTVVGGLSNVPFTSAQHFNAVGFSEYGTTSAISSLTLKRLPPTYTGTSSTVAIGATIATATRIGAVNGQFTLTRSGYLGSALEVSLALSGTASNGTDYESTPTTVTFPAGQATVTVPVLPLPAAGIQLPASVVATIVPAATYTVAASPSDTATVTILDGTMETLTVNSAHGTPTPGGTSSLAYGTAVTASVISPVTENSIVYVSTGWTGTGNVGSGTGTSVSFTLTSNSTLTWQWVAAGANPWGGNSSVDSNWGTAANWGSGVAPGAGDTLTFMGTTRPTNINNLAADTSFAGLNFINTIAGQAFSLSGNRITLGGDIWLATANGTISDSSSIPMILSGNRTITTSANHNLTLSGILSGTGGLTKDGNATLTLNAASTFTGDVNINAGTLRVAYVAQTTNPTATGLGNPQVARSISVNSGATLAFDVHCPLGDLNSNTIAASLIINGGAVINPNSWSTTLGPVTLNGGTMTAGAGNMFYGYSYGFNNGNITVGGSSASTLSGDGSTYSTYKLGAATVTFNVADATSSPAADLLVTAPLVGGGKLAKSGNGTMLLSGNNTYTGNTAVSVGTLQFAKMASLYNGTSGNWTAAKINVKSGATLALNVDSAATAGFDSTNLNSLLTNISVAGNATSGLQSGAILGLDTSTATGGTFTQGNVIANSTGANGGAIGLAKLGAGTLVLDKTNTYTGATSVTAGTLSLTNACLADAANVALTTGAALNLNFSGTDTVGKLIIDGVEQYQGTWGGLASSALHKTAAITGPGLLNVTAGPVAPTPTVTTAPTASAITYGQTLASSTLSGGVASVPGTFAFTTPGTAPAVGTAPQPVTFTPADLANYATASLTVNVTVNPAGFDGWASGYGLTGAAALAAADPDGDGISNLIEYALGLDPTAANANPIQLSQVVVNGSTYLQLSVNRNPAVTNVLIEGLSAGTLGDPAAWSTGTTVTVSDTESVFTVRDNQPIETNNKRFLRLRFTLTP